MSKINTANPATANSATSMPTRSPWNHAPHPAQLSLAPPAAVIELQSPPTQALFQVTQGQLALPAAQNLMTPPATAPPQPPPEPPTTEVPLVTPPPALVKS